MPNKFLIFVLLTFVSFAASAKAEAFAAINKANTSNVNEKTIQKILRAESLNWENGNSIIVFIDELNSINSETFDIITGMTKSQFLEFWRIKYFSGRALMPKQIKSFKNAVDLLLENKNAVYVNMSGPVPEELAKNPEIKIIPLNF